jgi:hypothetical protein
MPPSGASGAGGASWPSRARRKATALSSAIAQCIASISHCGPRACATAVITNRAGRRPGGLSEAESSSSSAIQATAP